MGSFSIEQQYWELALVLLEVLWPEPAAWWQRRKQDDSSLAMIEKRQLAAEAKSCCRHSQYMQAAPTVVVAERLE